jgi:hypothetical protein
MITLDEKEYGKYRIFDSFYNMGGHSGIFKIEPKTQGKRTRWQ